MKTLNDEILNRAATSAKPAQTYTGDDLAMAYKDGYAAGGVSMAPVQGELVGLFTLNDAGLLEQIPPADAKYVAGTYLYTAQPVSPAPAPGYCKTCKDYTIEEPLFAQSEQTATLQPVSDKLLQIIAATYQIVGAYEAPAHVLDVLANPEMATQEQIDALLPFVPATSAKPAVQGEPVLQIKQYGYTSMWMDCSQAEYSDCTTEKRTLYTTPQPATSAKPDQTYTGDDLAMAYKDGYAAGGVSMAQEGDAKDAERYRWLRELPNADSLNIKYMGCDLDMIIDSELAAIASQKGAQ